MRSASLCAWFKELHFNFAAQPSLRAWLSCFFTGGTQRKTAAAALVSYGNSRAAGRLSADINTIFENCDNRKRTAVPGKTHVQQSFFAPKRADGALCSARYSGLPTPFPNSRHKRNCDASRNFIDCNPQKARRRKSRQQGTVHSLRSTKKAKADSPLTRTAGCYPSSNKVFIREMLPPHRNMTMSVRKASFTELSIAELRFCCTKIVIF